MTHRASYTQNRFRVYEALCVIPQRQFRHKNAGGVTVRTPVCCSPGLRTLGIDSECTKGAFKGTLECTNLSVDMSTERFVHSKVPLKAPFDTQNRFRVYEALCVIPQRQFRPVCHTRISSRKTFVQSESIPNFQCINLRTVRIDSEFGIDVYEGYYTGNSESILTVRRLTLEIRNRFWLYEALEIRNRFWLYEGNSESILTVRSC